MRVLRAAHYPDFAPQDTALPNIRWLLAFITNVHRFLYTRSGGRLGHTVPFFGFRFLLLGCRGRKSGREYVTPLLYVPDGERFVVVGSNAGDHREPSWWLNLKASGGAWIQAGRERFPVTARVADGAEAERLWPRVIATYAAFARYRARAERTIPLVVLERRAEGASEPRGGR